MSCAAPAVAVLFHIDNHRYEEPGHTDDSAQQRQAVRYHACKPIESLTGPAMARPMGDVSDTRLASA